jgi:ABC-type transporter Mla MlaB component
MKTKTRSQPKPKSRISTLMGFSALGVAETLTWRSERTESGEPLVVLTGEIDENADLARLATQIRGPLTLDLKEVRRINSAGVREWVNFMRQIEHVKGVKLARCSMAMVNQLNMIYNFKGAAAVESFFAPYSCDPCDKEVDVLLTVDVHFPDPSQLQPPKASCPRCGGALEFDDIPERYFSFIVQS